MGIASVHGGVDLSWGMVKNAPWRRGQAGGGSLPPDDYYALAERFDPKNYDPEKWLSAAKAAGMSYAVLTVKPHDGYTLWPSTGGIGTQTHLGGRDFVGPYVAACRRLGLKIGFLYSPTDWHYEKDYLSWEYTGFRIVSDWLHDGATGKPPLTSIIGTNYRPAILRRPPVDFVSRYVRLVREDLTTLLTRYGPIDLLWFDGRPYPLGYPGAMSAEEIKRLQPAILINQRLYGTGDYESLLGPEPVESRTGRWEWCVSMHSGGWGFSSGAAFKSARELASAHKRVRNLGGHFLLNCGLQPDGDMPPTFYEFLDEWSSLGEL